MITAESYIEQRLPARLVASLYKLARKYRSKGIQVIIFGSFARKEDRKTSDLDMGVQWAGNRSSRIFMDFCRDVRDLPTIRKIDVVDLDQVDASFRNKALDEGIKL